MNFAKIYNGDRKIFSVRLKEDKTYQIKFGDGAVGSRLGKNDKIIVFYLETNGADGQLQIDDIDQSNLKLTIPKADSYNLTDSSYMVVVGIPAAEAKSYD